MNTAWRRSPLASLLLLPLALASGLALGPAARAAGPPAAYANTLHTFLPNQTYYGDGATPEGKLVQGTDGEFYGTTSVGAANGNGTIFRVNTNQSFQVLHTFSAVTSNVNTDGANPLAGLTQGADGFFYGTTTTGGAHNLGTIFKISADGAMFTVLHSFATADGTGSAETLVQAPAPNGFLYGTAPTGGSSGNGTVFAIKTDGTQFTVVHTFAALTSNANTDGAHPQAGLTLGNNGYVFGLTSGGGAHNSGEIFAVSLTNGVFTPLYGFTAKNGSGFNADGAAPLQPLVRNDRDGFLYGLASTGGTTGNGTFFKISLSGSGFQALRSFANNSESVRTLMLASDHQFYGTNLLGGENSTGEVRRLSPDGTSDVSVYSFDALNNGANSIGTQIDAPLIQGQGHDPSLYGVAAAGGNYGSGTVFQLFNILAPARAHILWNNVDGRAALWTVNADDSFTSIIYPAAAGYTANAVSEGNDGTVHLLWNSTNGAASVWNVDATTGVFLGQYTYGPATGYKLVSLATGVDNLDKLLWQRSDGQASVWNADPKTGAYTHIEYGPFPNWTPKLIAANETLNLFWQRNDGLNALWTATPLSGLVVSPTFLPNEPGFLDDFFYTPTSYAPYADQSNPPTPSTLVGLAVNGYSSTPGDFGSPEYLWGNADGSVRLDIVGIGENGFDGPNSPLSYGPYPGWAPKSVAAGPDNRTRILWSDQFGTTALWNLQDYSFTNAEYGPFPGWTAVAVSAGL